ncbi:MAG: diaminopimelate decarboxylase [Pseudomonadota bacterium]
MTDAICYCDGVLHIDKVPVSEIAQACGTPVYIYSAAVMHARYRLLETALPEIDICYGMKACDTLAVINLFIELGAGIDVVSGGEIQRVLAARGDPRRIVFSGVGKTDEEITFALRSGVGQINAESASEVIQIARLAQAAKVRAPVALRLNPDIPAGGHQKIQTGHARAKFGMAVHEIGALYGQDIAGIDWRGLAVHIGSQIHQVAPYDKAFGVLAELITTLAHPVTHIDLGGGFAVAYRAGDPVLDLSDYRAMVARHFDPKVVRLLVEPGRFLTAPAAILVARVIHDKHTGNHRHVIIDAAMNDLLRPSLYDAFHNIIPIQETHAPASPADIVGPICETGDTFTRDHTLPSLEPGALVAICDVGAYGAVMASNYNARPRAPQVLVDGTRFRVIRPRESFADMIRGETDALSHQ